MPYSKQTFSFVLITFAVIAILIPTIARVQSEPLATDDPVSAELRELDTAFVNAELALANANLEYVLEQNAQRSS